MKNNITFVTCISFKSKAHDYINRKIMVATVILNNNINILHYNKKYTKYMYITFHTITHQYQWIAGIVLIFINSTIASFTCTATNYHLIKYMIPMKMTHYIITYKCLKV